MSALWPQSRHPVFADRRAAGVVLAVHLRRFAGRPDVLILTLPQ